MPKLIVGFCLGLCLFVSSFQLFAQSGNIVDMYTLVDSVTQFAPAQKELALICQKHVQQRYISFIGSPSVPTRRAIFQQTLTPRSQTAG